MQANPITLCVLGSSLVASPGCVKTRSAGSQGHQLCDPKAEAHADVPTSLIRVIVTQANGDAGDVSLRYCTYRQA